MQELRFETNNAEHWEFIAPKIVDQQRQPLLVTLDLLQHATHGDDVSVVCRM
jgi:hypothetical protein